MNKLSHRELYKIMVMSVNVRVKENKPYDVLHCLEAKDAQNMQRGLTDTPVFQRGVNHLLPFVSHFNSVREVTLKMINECRA